MTNQQDSSRDTLCDRYYEEFNMIIKVFPCTSRFYDCEQDHPVALMYVRACMVQFGERTLKSFLIHLNYFLNECNDRELYEVSRKVHNMREWATCASVLIATYGGNNLDNTLATLAEAERANTQNSLPGSSKWIVKVEQTIQGWAEKVSRLIDMKVTDPVDDYIRKTKKKTCANCLFDCYLNPNTPACNMWQERSPRR